MRVNYENPSIYRYFPHFNHLDLRHIEDINAISSGQSTYIWTDLHIMSELLYPSIFFLHEGSFIWIHLFCIDSDLV